MGPKNLLKNVDKTHHPNKGGRGNKRVLVTSRPVAPPAAPSMPMISKLEFPVPVFQRTVSIRPIRKWSFKNGNPVLNPLLKKSYLAQGKEVILSEGPAPFYFLKKGDIVHVRRQNIKIPGDVPFSSWSEITYEETRYDRTVKQWVTSRVAGWVNDAYLDDYHEPFPDFGVEIPRATKDSTDAQQFMTMEDDVEFSIKTNMCGQLCVAFVVKQDIDTVLKNWKTNGKKNYYQSLVGKGQNRTTSREHLKDILDLYYTGADDLLPFRAGLIAIPLAAPPTEPNYPHASNELQERLKTHSLITLVRIDVNTGELKPVEYAAQRNHWIVVDKITRNGNRVELYNPFPNKRQEYSFQEFYKSVGSNPSSGWWVKRKDVSPGVFSEDALKMKLAIKVAIANPNPVYTAAQYIDVDGKKQTNLCGEFCVALIVKDSINTVLEKWKEDQPLLYTDIIGNNKPTGPLDLITILKSYGYNNDDDIIEFSALLGDPYTNRYLPSPGRIAKMLKTHFLIAGVNIDGNTGRLKPPDAVPHWVVVDKILPFGRNAGGNGGWVELYNPFSNSWEEYSYNEFTSAIGPGAREYGAGWNGLWVKRDIVPLFVQQAVVSPSGRVSPVEGRRSQKRGRPRKWTKQQVRAVLKQRLNRRERANQRAAKVAGKSGLKKQDSLKRSKKRKNANADPRRRPNK